MILSATLGLAVSVFGQGQVNLANNAGSLVRINDAVAGTAVPVGSITFSLLSGADAGSLTALTGTAGTSTVLAGRIANTVFNVPSAPNGQTAFFQIRAWDSSFASFAAAQGAGALTGASDVFSANTSLQNPGDPPPTPVSLAGRYAGFAVVVPEPSTIALGLIGAGSLLFLRRKK